MMFILVLLSTVYGHGRLLRPATRVGHDNYENDPTGSSGNGGNANEAWVCRHAASAVAATSVVAGSTINLQWDFGAKHVGDCDAYISYDVGASRYDMKWFKIGNFFDCRQNSDREVDHPIVLPAFLQNGAAVLRWGWYALHQHPNVEFYSQCADITITGGVATLDPNIKTYSLTGPNGNDPIFPLRADEGVGYSNRFPPVQEWMTGPPCALGISDDVNDCYRTAKGTQGYIDIGQTDQVPASTPSTTSSSSGATDPPLTESTMRCGCTWSDANRKCGEPCTNAGSSDECSGTDETCYDQLKTCSEIGISNSCTTWVTKEGNDAVPEGWCQLTCTSAATLQYCDSDACQCAEINYNGLVFSVGGSSQALLALLCTLVGVLQF